MTDKPKKKMGRPETRIIPRIPTSPEKLAAIIARDKHSPTLKSKR